MFIDLETATHFSAVELEKLHQIWGGPDATSEEIDREAFAKGMASLNITDALVIEQYFTAFDRDNNGLVNFKEFVIGTSS